MARRRKNPGFTPPPLHELETEVMEEMWRQGEAVVRDVMRSLNRSSTKERAYTTYMTILQRLADKGMLVRHRISRTDVYRPALSREHYQQLRARTEVDHLLDQYGPLALAHFATHVGDLDAQHLEDLRGLVGDS